MVTIRLKDRSNGCESLEVSLEELIYHQSEIEFRFPNYTDHDDDEPYEAQLPYKDFLFFSDDYDVHVRITND